MYFVFFVTIIIVGLLAASSLVENKVPQIKPVLAYLKPHEGWIGLVSMVLGIFWLLRMLRYIGYAFKFAFLSTLIYLFALFLIIALGFLLSQNLLRKFGAGKPKITDFINKMIDKVAPLKEMLGLTAIGTGLLNLIIRLT